MKIMKINMRKILCVSFLFFLSFFIYGICIYLIFGTWGASGVFGDSFGAINAFFTGAVLFTGVYALILQKNEIDKNLKSQKEQFNEQRAQHVLLSRLNTINSLILGSTERLRDHAKTFSSMKSTDYNSCHGKSILELNQKIDNYLSELELIYEEFKKTKQHFQVQDQNESS